jgi:hypothetical protein
MRAFRLLLASLLVIASPIGAVAQDRLQPGLPSGEPDTDGLDRFVLRGLEQPVEAGSEDLAQQELEQERDVAADALERLRADLECR